MTLLAELDIIQVYDRVLREEGELVKDNMKKLYELLAYHTDRSLFLLDMKSGTVHTSPKAAAELGIQPDQPDFAEALLRAGGLPEDTVTELRSVRRKLDGGAIRGRTELRLIDSSGMTAWYDFRYTRLTDGGRPLDFVLASVDHLMLHSGDGRDPAQYDLLTDVYNRKAFADRFTSATMDLRENSVNALILVDIDSLQEVNRSLGHQQGDAVLRRTSETLMALLRENEFCGRLGGGEFLLYLPNLQRVSVLQKRMRIICAALRRKLKNGIEISAALGAVVLPRDGTDFNALCEKTNAALYRAKQMRGERFAIYSPGMTLADAAGERKGPDRSRVFVRTFGFFDVFVDGMPIYFRGAQAKELMALLVDRRGGLLSPEEAISRLWEDAPADKTTLARYRKVAMRLKQSLEEAGIADIIESRNGRRRCLPDRFRCDYYNFLEDSGDRSFTGAYMSNYSWGEGTLAELERKAGERGASF